LLGKNSPKALKNVRKLPNNFGKSRKKRIFAG